MLFASMWFGDNIFFYFVIYSSLVAIVDLMMDKSENKRGKNIQNASISGTVIANDNPT